MPSGMEHAWIISVGTELALGQTVDTNAAWLATQLLALGIRPRLHLTVPDDAAGIRDALLRAANAADLILVTGGLGPTDDDLTRHALASAAGLRLRLHTPSLDQIRARFAARGREMSASNRIQAMIPLTATAIPNTRGTAPGIHIMLRGTPCYALPGVPSEMRTMFERDIGPQLRAVARGRVIRTRRLQTFGLGESVVGERIADLMRRGRNPEVGTTAELGIISVHINARADAPAEAARLLDDTEAEIRRRLGDSIFGRGEDTLSGVVGELLAARGQTVSTAESCTGGLIGALLTDVSGSSRYYAGGAVTYANEAKTELLGVCPADLEQYGAVSAPVAQAMACGVAERLHSDYAISATGVAGPTGGTPAKPVGLVFIGLHTPSGTTVAEHHFGHDSARSVIRMRAARTALNLLRLRLLD